MWHSHKTARTPGTLFNTENATMKTLLLAAAVALLAGPALAADKDKAKGKKVDFQVYSQYFVSNKAGLKQNPAYLAFTDAKSFNKVFGKAVVMGRKPHFLANDAFETKMVAAVVKRGNKVWSYKVDRVSADDRTLTVRYEAKSRDGGGATFVSPLIVAVDKGKYSRVVFVENGKQVGTATVGK